MTTFTEGDMPDIPHIPLSAPHLESLPSAVAARLGALAVTSVTQAIEVIRHMLEELEGAEPGESPPRDELVAALEVLLPLVAEEVVEDVLDDGDHELSLGLLEPPDDAQLAAPGEVPLEDLVRDED